MAKFKVNDNVVVKETGEKGVVKCREAVIDKDAKRTNVTYLVKLGEGFENYKVFTRNELTKVIPVEVPTARYMTKVYEAPNGYKVTLVSIVDVDRHYEFDYSDDMDEVVEREVKTKHFNLGVSFYNPSDEFDENVGYKIARHRAVNSPFCSLSARFLGEFSESTVEALMDVKAKYIIEHIDRFVHNA